MSSIANLNEAWNKHSGIEVETFLKSQLTAMNSDLNAKIGWVDFDADSLNLLFKSQEGDPDDQALRVIELGGELHNILIESNVSTAFYVLGDETEKIITLTPSTTVTSFGSAESSPEPETYTYVVSVNNGNGYIQRTSGRTEHVGDSISVNIRDYLNYGDNYIKFSLTGQSTNYTKSFVFTATLTSLSLSCSHTWDTVWAQGENYIINGIRFAGSIDKTLHVKVDNTELPSVDYLPNQSYTTTATTYTIPSTAFPASENGVHTISLWMTASGISTKVTTYHIMCAVNGDESAIICINEVAETAINFTSNPIFKYAVYNCNSAKFTISGTFGETVIPVVVDQTVTASAGTRYSYATELAMESTETTGTLSVVATAVNGSTDGKSDTATLPIDNTYSYIATEGAKFYMNAATRSNNETTTRETIINDMGASTGWNATYPATFTAFNWFNDGWITETVGTGDNAKNLKALYIPAGSTVSIPSLQPLGSSGRPFSSYSNGLTIEMMIKSAYPSDYDTPVLTIGNANTPIGIIIYPTKICVYSNSETSESQMVNLCENQITHLTITFVKNYGNISGRNLCSIYVNGISNLNFSFSGSSNFGTGAVMIGQDKTDFYLYKFRVYDFALEDQAVLNNFLNAIVDGIEFNRLNVFQKNQLLDGGGSINYDAAKAAGFNTMIVTMDTPSHDIPSYDNDASFDGCSVKFEYADKPEWNVTVSNVSLDGQGTTSKKYFRWNLRAKTNDNTYWEYADGTAETGKSGYFAGTDYPRVDRITAKKNYASSMQGHKMGITGLYNDLFKAIINDSELPDDEYRVAVYQFPFVGFKYNPTNNSYTYIGLYTTGPDKSSKPTFGYGSSYNKLLSLEGPNHNPRGTRFLHPWVDVTYDYTEETLKIGGEEAWDCDFVGAGLKSDKSSDAAAILALYESEWKPAYSLVFDCSPYIVSATEMAAGLTGISTVSDLTNAANSVKILAGTTNGISNSLLSFYDSSYNIYFYRTSEGKFVSLQSVGYANYNAKTAVTSYLSTSSPSTAQLIAARAAKFLAEYQLYFYKDQLLYHYCFCELLGITDNFAKNSYPFKFNAYDAANSNRWGWRQDDLDTAFITDNNGNQTKSYSVEVGDVNPSDGSPLFQGGNSALWVLVKNNLQNDLRNTMSDILSASSAIASSLHIQGSAAHQTLYNLISYYCWEKSAKYFSPILYEKDKDWSYIEPWLINPTQEYNSVRPLTQALGDQYQAEKLWVERRIAYIFSKYRLGAFNVDNTGYNTTPLTLAQNFTFTVTPAIDLYPAIAEGSTTKTGGRTSAGTTTAINLTGDGQTTDYIKATDWMKSLGDLSGMLLSARGGGDISFSVQSNRLEDLKIGDGTSSNVVFNAKSLGVSSPTLLSIDARNVVTLNTPVSLLNCPRIRTALFAGSGATGLSLPVGAKITSVSFPANCNSVFMHSLSQLQTSGLTLPSTSAIQSIYIENCPNLNPLNIVTNILADNNNQLTNVTLKWPTAITANTTNGYINTLEELATGDYGYLSYDGGEPVAHSGHPDLEGVVDTDDDSLLLSNDIYDTISDAFPKVTLDMPSAFYIDFEDENVESICLANWDTNGDGVIKFSEAEAVTTFNLAFKGNASIEDFKELKYFKNVTLRSGNGGTATSSNYTNLGGDFGNCQNLKTIELPKDCTEIPYRCFYHSPSLEEVDLSNIESIGYDAFNRYNNTSNTHFILSDKLKYLSVGSFGSGSTFNKIPESIVLLRKDAPWSGGPFANCILPTTTLYLPNLEGEVGGFNNTNVERVTSLGKATGINTSAFKNCAALQSVILPDTVTRLGEMAFSGCTQLSSINTGNITEISAGGFYGCTRLDNLDMSNVTYLGGSSSSRGALEYVGTSTLAGGCEFYFPKIVTASNMSTKRAATVTFGSTFTTGNTNGNNEVSYCWVKFLSTTPMTINTAFLYSSGSNSSTISSQSYYPPIYVPKESLEAYRSATNWSSTTNQIVNRLRGFEEQPNVEFVTFESYSIPSEYTEVEYIRNNFNNMEQPSSNYGRGSYIVTDYYPYYHTQYLFDVNIGNFDAISNTNFYGCEILGTYSSKSSSYTTSFGIGRNRVRSDDTLPNNALIYYHSNTNFYTSPTADFYPDLNRRGTIKCKYNYLNFLDKWLPLSEPSAGQVPTTNPLNILNNPRSNYAYNLSHIKIYRLAFFDPIDGITDYDDNSQYTCVRDFIPCKRNSDSVYGLYEVKTQTFYPSANANYPFLGPE